MKKIFLLSGLLFLCFSASATMYSFNNPINSAQEVPTNISTGTGTMSGSYNDVDNMLTYNVTFSGLTSAVTAAHFHGPAAAGANAGVIQGIAGPGATSPITGNMTLTAAQETDMLNGLWYVNIHTTMFGGGEIRGQLAAVPLPVELISFTAITKNGMAYLNWKTATELNNDYFQVDYSQDGRHFVAIGTVKGQGTSQEAKKYTYVHRLPAKGINYYRLRQVDFDGSYTYSAVVSVEVDIKETRIFPNPTTGVLMFHSPSSEGTIRVTDSMGKLVQQQNLAQQQTIDISQQPKGVYFVELQTDIQTTVQRVVKE